MLQSMLNTLANSDPATAMELAEAQPYGLKRFAGQIAQGLVQQEGALAAMDWIDTLPDGNAKRNAIQSIS